MHYEVIKNEMGTYDIAAVGDCGFILAYVEDVSCNRTYAENVAWVFTQNGLLPVQLLEAVQNTVGLIL